MKNIAILVIVLIMGISILSLITRKVESPEIKSDSLIRINVVCQKCGDVLLEALADGDSEVGEVVE